LGLAKVFRREVIAEGAETIAHGLALLQLGCELAQGYGISRLCLPVIFQNGHLSGKRITPGRHEQNGSTQMAQL
jgi:EAL domain-containing protein (putative c-di-GMP-specific phosphodiesterase class I)